MGMEWWRLGSISTANRQFPTRICASPLLQALCGHLRVSKSLEADTVFREVVDSSRMLIGAGCSLIATMGEAGKLEDFVSSGLSPEEHQRFLDLLRGSDLWAYFCQLPKPLRLRDLAAHLRSLGFPDN